MLQTPDFSMILMLAIFFATLWVLNRFLFAPITAILKEREEEERRSSGAHEEALGRFNEAAGRIEAELAAARREGLKLREERRAQGRRLREEKVASVKGEATTRVSDAAAAVERQSRQAAAELPARIRDLARQLAEKILGRRLAA
jgi:F-type H+-transporting ATPase subunit b